MSFHFTQNICSFYKIIPDLLHISSTVKYLNSFPTRKICWRKSCQLIIWTRFHYQRTGCKSLSSSCDWKRVQIGGGLEDVLRDVQYLTELQFQFHCFLLRQAWRQSSRTGSTLTEGTFRQNKPETRVRAHSMSYWSDHKFTLVCVSVIKTKC